MTEAFLYILLGLALLYGGGEALVRGAASLAVRGGFTPMVAGLTFVAFGTSTPELFTSVNAVFAGKGNIAVGNAVGANIFNVGMVLGVTVLLFPLRPGLRFLKFDAPAMLGVVMLPVWVLWDRAVSPVESAILLGLLVVYTVAVLRMARRPERAGDAAVAEFESAVVPLKGSVWLDVALIAAGIAMLAFGSRWLVDSAVAIARHFEMSEAVIGLTIVAAGTSLPELAACLVAASRSQPDVALGNVIGSNIFNVLAVIGACGVAGGITAPGVGMMDVTVMIIFSAAVLPMLWSGMTLDRWEGFSLVAAYAVYVWWHWPR